ncbi:splicing factor YJU2-like [Ornithodoros turicata]|uniref:splicing factor YJU2-like n=1 Tax=Ornithodoros turicata TaxID=34597 RepID=UPI0031398D0D
MSERKVLNKYYPPDFDPRKIPRLRLPKDRQYTVRLMAPCNMRCTTCGEYIYKGKKFNSRKETVQNEEYLGIKIFRFYIKCPRCLAEITFKTDPENADYIVEHGATRNFQALKLAEEQAEREAKEEEEEEKNNPMKLLEKRTEMSKQEMDLIEALEDLKDLNRRQANVNFDAMLEKYGEDKVTMLQRQEEEDEEFVRSVFGKGEEGIVKRIKDEDDDASDEEVSKKPRWAAPFEKPTDILISGSPATVKQEPGVPSTPVGTASKKKLSSKSLLAGLVKVKPAATVKPEEPCPATSNSVRSDAITKVESTSSLSLLCSYSGSDDSE